MCGGGGWGKSDMENNRQANGQSVYHLHMYYNEDKLHITGGERERERNTKYQRTNEPLTRTLPFIRILQVAAPATQRSMQNLL